MDQERIASLRDVLMRNVAGGEGSPSAFLGSYVDPSYRPDPEIPGLLANAGKEVGMRLLEMFFGPPARVGEALVTGKDVSFEDIQGATMLGIGAGYKGGLPAGETGVGMLKILGIPRLAKALAVLEPSMRGKILTEELRKGAMLGAEHTTSKILSRRRGQLLAEGIETPQSVWRKINDVKGEPALDAWGQYRAKGSTIALGPGARAGTWRHEVPHVEQAYPASGAEEYLMTEAKGARNALWRIQRGTKSPTIDEWKIYNADPWEVHARMFEDVKGLNTSEKFNDFYQRSISPAMTESAYLVKKVAEEFPEYAIPLRSVAADIRKIAMDADEAYRVSGPQRLSVWDRLEGTKLSNERFSFKAEREGVEPLSAGKGEPGGSFASKMLRQAELEGDNYTINTWKQIEELPEGLKRFATTPEKADRLRNFDPSGTKPTALGVAPPAKNVEGFYRPANQLYDGTVVWHEFAKTHRQALDLNFNTAKGKSVTSSGGLDPEGNYWKFKEFGDDIIRGSKAKEESAFAETYPTFEGYAAEMKRMGVPLETLAVEKAKGTSRFVNVPATEEEYLARIIRERLGESEARFAGILEEGTVQHIKTVRLTDPESTLGSMYTREMTARGGLQEVPVQLENGMWQVGSGVGEIPPEKIKDFAQLMMNTKLSHGPYAVQWAKRILSGDLSPGKFNPEGSSRSIFRVEKE